VAYGENQPDRQTYSPTAEPGRLLSTRKTPETFHTSRMFATSETSKACDTPETVGVLETSQTLI
jgi:hypothetical protein